MKTWIIRVALAAGAWVGTEAPAGAQYPQQIRNPPAYSPYLNLTRPGGNLAQNYYGLVRPEINAYNAIGSLQGQVNTLGQQDAALVGALESGHPTTFMNFSHYYGNSPARAARNSLLIQGNTGGGVPGGGNAGGGLRR
jgi:hypothetical protein